MRGPLVFAAAALFAIVAWVAWIGPSRATPSTGEIATGEIVEAGPSVEERAAAAEKALTPPAPSAPPRGLAADGNGIEGIVPWSEVPGVLAWVAEQPGRVLRLEVTETGGADAARVVIVIDDRESGR